MKMSPEIFEAGIVVLGAFAPASITPDWLEKNNLVGASDAEFIRKQENVVISHQVTILESEWFQLQVLENRLTLSSKGPVSPAHRDLVLGIFSANNQIPVTALGINFMAHYKMENEDAYHKIGDTLAPKDVWYQLFTADKNHVGLLDLNVMVQPTPRGTKSDVEDFLRIHVQPSGKIKNGIYFLFNNHKVISIEKEIKKTPADLVCKALEDTWQESFDKSREYAEKMISAILKL